MAKPLSFDQSRARELHAAGMSCRAIADELGVSTASISRWAARNDLSFDRGQTAAATQARQIDLAASRTLLTQKMLTVAHDLIDKVNDPYLVFAFGGRENAYNEHELQSMPVEAKQRVLTIAAIAFDKASKLLERENAGLPEALSILDRLEAELDAEFADFDDAELGE